MNSEAQQTFSTVNKKSKAGAGRILGEGGVLLSIPRENGQKVILKNYFSVFLSNGKIVYYQIIKMFWNYQYL